MADDVDVVALRTSFEKIEPVAKDFAFWFYAHLFAAHEIAKSFFPPDMRIQRDRFVKAMVRIVADVERLDRLTTYLRRLGQKHAVIYHVQPSYYVWVGESLLATLAHFLGQDKVHELEQWRRMFNKAKAIMLEGAAQGYGQSVQGDDLIVRIQDQPLRLGWLVPRGYRATEVDERISILSGIAEQAISDAADARRDLEEADEEIRRLRDYYYVENSDLRRAPSHRQVDVKTVDGMVRQQKALEN